MSKKKKQESPRPEESPTEEPLPRLGAEEIKTLGVDLFSGKLFTTFHIEERDHHLASSIFMPLVLMKQEDRDALAAKKPHVFYEYLDKAGPRAINGYPIFASVRFMVREDWVAVVAIANKMKEASDKI